MRRTFATVAAVAISVLVAACGSGDGMGSYKAPTGPPVKTIKLEGTSYKFTPSKVDSPPGIIEFELDNTDGIPHSFRIKNVDGFQIEASAGKTATGKVKLPAGTYTFYCDIPGHESSGMKG